MEQYCVNDKCDHFDAHRSGDVYTRLFAGAFRDLGQWNGQQFNNADLQRMSTEMQVLGVLLG